MLQTAQQWEQFEQSLIFDTTSKTACREFKSYYPCKGKRCPLRTPFLLCKNRVRLELMPHALSVWRNMPVAYCVAKRCEEGTKACFGRRARRIAKQYESLTTPVKEKGVRCGHLFCFVKTE